MRKNIRPGLVSVTFRGLEAGAIVDLAVRARLEAIEWGGDVHVPHGDLKAARQVSRLTADAGLAVAAYGSYYVVGNDANLPFETVLETALELGAPIIRVWAGNKGSADAGTEYRELIADESRRIGDLAEAAGLAVSYEYHAGTLTDTSQSAVSLLESVSHNAIRTYWQPPVGLSLQECRQELEAVLPWLTNVHVFHWYPSAADRLPLSEGADRWDAYLDIAASTGREHFALLEFVKDGEPGSLLRDAAVLREWLG